MRTSARSGALAEMLFLLAALLLAAVGMVGSVRVAAQETPHAGDPGQVKAHVREILQQSEFQPESADSPMARLGRQVRSSWEGTSRWVQERWGTFRKWLEHLFSGFGGPGAGAAASVISNVFAALFIGLGGWLIAWLIRSILVQRRRRAAKARTAYDEAEDDEGVIPEPSAWMQQAGVYADGGDWRRAFRAVFVAILLLLDQGGLIEFDRSRTNGDYLRLLRKKSIRQIYDLLDPLVLEFDRRWYGGAETGQEDYARIQQTYQLVRTLMAEPASETAAATLLGKA